MVRVAPGRALRWSPPWPCSDAAILFDASSGDYWVLAGGGQHAVRTLEREGPLQLVELLSRLPGPPADALALLQELAHSGIITDPGPAPPVKSELAVDTFD